MSPVFLFPFALNVASLAMVGGFLALLAVYFFAWARARFNGPVPGQRGWSSQPDREGVRAGKLRRGAREPGSRLTP